jgi:hypothetical protein
MLLTFVFIFLMISIGVLVKSKKVPGFEHPFKRLFGNKNDR